MMDTACRQKEKDRKETHKLHKRRGTFIIDSETLRTDPLLVQSILNECIVTEAVIRTDMRWSVEYRAISEHFRETSEVEVSPSYLVEVKDGHFIAFQEEAQTAADVRHILSQIRRKLENLSL